MIISLGYVGSAEADKAFLKALQDTLAKLGNPWIAGETDLSDLPLEEKRKLCGFLPMPEREWGPAPKIIEKPLSKNPPPASWDWRDKDGKNWMTPVKNQNPCGNCWAFAMCSAMESVLKVQNNTPDETPNLSEQFLTSCNTKGYSCYGGGQFTVFADVKNFGVCDEACFPYTASDKPCDNRCANWQDRVVRVKSYRVNYSFDVSDDQKKEWIMEGPMCVAVDAKEDFFYYKGGVYEPILGEKFNHAVCCIGWTSSGRWICKNSWGSTSPWPTFSVITEPCWVKMESAGTPVIWTSDSLNFVFELKGVFSPSSSIPCSDSDKTSSSANLDAILLGGEHILKPSQIKNIIEFSKSEDTLLYDDHEEGLNGWSGANYFGVRFTPPLQCKVIAGLSGRLTETEAKNDRLIVRDDAGGKPGTTIEEVPYTTRTSDSVIWYRQYLSTPYSDDNDFWLTYYAETDATTESRFVSDGSGGSRSYYSEDDGNNWIQHSADLLIRAIVTYGGGYAGSDIIWVKNIGGGTLVASNVNAAGSSNWIAFIIPTSFNVHAGDSAGIEIIVDTSGLQTNVPYTDEIVITSNSGKTETRIPISLFINSHGIAEEKESMLTTFKLFPNPFRDKVSISYFVPEKANVKLVVRDSAGREVAKIIDRIEDSGVKKIDWNTKNIPSGVYFCRLAIENSETIRRILWTRKVLLVK